MRVGIDIDGVVADFTGHINTTYEWWFGQECPIPSPWPEWESYKDAPEFPSWSVCSKWADKARLWETMPLIPGAAAGIDALLEDNHDLQFLTARTGKECIAQTQYWFQKNISEPFGLAMDRLRPNLSKSKHTVPCSVYVDDGPDELKALKEAGKSTIRFEHPYNLRRPATAKVKTWRELSDLIRSLES